MEECSKLRIYSLGVVVEKKPRGTDIVLVSPVEHLNIQSNGIILEHNSSFSGDHPTSSSKQFNTEHTAKDYIRAKWLSIGENNRTTAPDLNINETVLLFKFGDVDEYYWTDMFREPELRRLEDVTYSYSNLKEGLEAFSKDTSYFIRYNTCEKFIHLHTSDNDGEHTTYDITVNTDRGSITVVDGKGNNIVFDSKEDTLSAFFNKDINIVAGRDINISAGRHYNVDSQEDIGLTSNRDAIISVKRDMHRTIGSDMTSNIGNSVDSRIGNSINTDIGNSMSTSIGDSLSTDVGSNMSTSVANNVNSDIGNSITTNIGSSSETNVGTSKTTTVGTDVTSSIGGTINTTVGSNVINTIGGNVNDVISGGITTSASNSILIETGSTMRLDFSRGSIPSEFIIE